jgi:hypothetical protein
MISLTIDMHPIILEKSDSRQDGITLMLAVLVLSAITAIAFSLASIVLIEIRSSGDVLRTEPALYAVQGVTEEAFFKYKRYVSDDELSITSCQPEKLLEVCGLNGVTINNPELRTYDVAPRVDTVLAQKTNNYLLIDPEQPNSFDPVYDRVSVTYLQNGVINPLTVTIYKCCDSDGQKIIASGPTDLNPGNVFSYDIPEIPNDGQYELSIFNSGTTGNILAEVDAVLLDGKTHRLPFVGQQVLDMFANYLGLTRKYTVQIPLP